MKKRELTEEEINRIIEMAWEDRTSFDAIERQFGLPEKEVIALMRREMKRSSFNLWRKRVQGRKTKHDATKTEEDDHRFKSPQQRMISLNKLTKRR
ncbi:MAG: TIGR03643 family protein [Bacteroidota bacterium]